jgi:hypothetical protein
MKYKVIDNYLDEEYFNSLVNLFSSPKNTGNALMPWFFQSSTVYPKIGEDELDEDKFFYMVHMLYDKNVPISNMYEKLIPVFQTLGAKALIRTKINLYPNTETLHEHPMHTDYDFSHSAAILSLNTCDGYTKLKDGTKIDSVANRILFFDGSEEHCSTTTTNVPARNNININFV